MSGQPIIVMRNADGKTYTASYGFDAKGQTVDEAVQNLRDFLAAHNTPIPADANVMHIPNGDELESWEFAK